MREHTLQRDLNLLPASARERVLRAQEVSRSCRTALALTVIAATAAAASEAGRLQAMEACDAAERQAESALARDEHRRRLEAEVRHLAEAAVALQRSESQLPLSSILGAITDALPLGASLDRVRLVPDGTGDWICELSGNAERTPLSHFLDVLAQTRPFERVAINDYVQASERFQATFAIPNDRPYSVVQGDADVNADSPIDSPSHSEIEDLINGGGHHE